MERDLRQGWKRQLADGGPLVQRQRGGDRRKPPERLWHPARQGNYSGQPVKAAPCIATPTMTDKAYE